MKEAPCKRVLTIGAFALGAPESGVVSNVIERERYAVGPVVKEPVHKVGVREALVGAEGDVGTRE